MFVCGGAVGEAFSDHEIKTNKRIEPQTVITTKNGVTDTLFIYSK